MLKAGSQEVRKYFDIPDGCIRMDQCSFGVFPKAIIDKKISFLKEQTANPHAWFLENTKRYYHESLAALSELINCEKVGLHIVDNSTMAANLILKSISLPPGAEILLTSHIYKTIKNIALELHQLHGMRRITIHIPREIQSKEEIVQLYDEQFLTNPNISMALIDYVTSPSSIVMPVKEIVQLCKKYQVISFVDGSQTAGHIPLNLKRLEPDYFVGSLHKWTFTSLSGGFLWVAPQFRGSLRHLITAYAVSSPQPNFLDVGVRDFSSIYTLPLAIKCQKQLGGLSHFIHYSSEILSWAEEMLCQALGTRSRHVPKDMKAPMIGLVCLPPLPVPLQHYSNDELALQIAAKYNIQTAGFYDFNDAKWLRFTAHVYNKKEDYVKLKEALLDFLKITKPS